MDLSNDLISKFVKITNDGNKKETKEGTVYGTAVKYDGSIYVKIDGSDLLTPIDTTADIKEGERVTIMIKDHNATVTGNITSPSASSADVKKVTKNVEEIEGEITEFEAIIADVVHVGELDAEVARIDELIAGKATIEDLTATNAEITNLKAKDAEIENLVADKATIEDLTATNAEITNLKAKDAEIENLVADKATIEDLTATNAEITNLKANKADITYLDANFATIDELEATHANIDVLDAEVANINTLVNGNLTSDNILSFNITSKNTTMEDAFIKDAMIDRITANKIMSGTIDTNNVVIQSTDGSMLLQGNILQMKDESGKVRIQIGKDNGGNFTFVLYDETGKGVLIDEEGIKSSDAIADGLIVDAKVADNANISGSKLDIASVITEVNNDNSTTIKSSKIYLNEQNQSLEVAFNSLKTQVETIQDVTIDGDLSNIVEQVQSNTTKIEANKEGINTLVAENVIRTEEINDLEGELQQVNTTLSNKYASLEQNLDGFKTTVSDTYTTKTEFDNLEVGGRNLVLNSGPMTLEKWHNLDSWSNTLVACSTSPTGYAIRAVCNKYTGNQGGVYQGWPKKELLTADVEMCTVSAWIRASKPCTMAFYFERQSWHTVSLSTEWQYYTYTDIHNTTRPNYACIFYVIGQHVEKDMWFEVHSLKLEKGGKATDWTPAPEDVQANIDAVDGKFANYSTTTQMNSAINQKANEITSSVSSTYTTKSEFNTLNIGSTNLVAGTKDFSSGWAYHTYYMTKTNETAIDSRFTGMSISFTPSTAGDDYADLGKTKCVWLEPDTEYTLSFWAKGTGKFYTYLWGTSVGPVASHYNSSGYSGTQNDGSSIHILSSNDTFKRYWVVYKTKSTTQGSYNLVATRVAKNLKTDVSMIIYGVKFEKGNKPTDWSPAPEDVQANIDAVDGKFANYSTTTQMNSAIAQKANEITSSVSSTYTTKTEFQNLEVGGRNYLTEAKRLAVQVLAAGTGSTLTVSTNHAECPHGYYLLGAKDGGSSIRIPYVITSNGVWTVSFELKGSQSATVGFNMDICDLETARFVTTTDNKWVKHSLTVNVTNYSADIHHFIDLANLPWAYVYIRNIKVEKGSKATDWSPAPEDVQANIDAVDGKFANYSTTTQMNSAIAQKANEITSSVSSTYTTKTEFNNLKVGGRNLIRHSNVINRNATSASYDKSTATWTLTANAGTGDSWGAGLVLTGNNVRIPYGKTYVLSFEIKVPRACSWNIDVNNSAITGSNWNGNDNDNGSVRATSSKSLVANQWIKCWSRISNTNSGNTNKVDIYDSSNFGVVMLNETSSMTYQIRNIQGEIGNIPSEYSPAPEDVQSQIDTINTNLTTYATKSELTQTNNSIVAKFSESGGYNLIKNSTGYGGSSGWTVSSGYVTSHQEGPLARTGNSHFLYFVNSSLVTQEIYAYSSRFPLKGGKKYTLSGWFYMNPNVSSYDIFILTSNSLDANSTSTAYTYVHHSGSRNNTGWEFVSLTFTTNSDVKSGIIRIDNNGYNGNGTTTNCNVHWSSLMLNEGSVALPWSPHPSEIYDGITKIDKNGLQVSQSNYNGYTQMKADGFYVNNGSENVISITKDGSYFKGKVVITSGSTVPTSVLSGTISSSQLNSSITSDISTAKSNASTAVSTANTASTNASNAVKTANTASTNASTAVSTANTASTNASNAVKTANTASTNASTAVSTANTAKSTANTAKSTADSVKSTVDSGKTNWNNAYNRVNEWAYGAVTGSTTIDGGYIQADTITAKHMAIGDFNNYSQLVKGKSLVNRYGTATWTEGTSNHSYWVTTNQYFPFTVNETLNPFKASDRVQIKFDAYTPSTRNVKVGIWFYSGTAADTNIGSITADVSCSATWGTKTVNLTLPSGNTYVQSAKSIAILIDNGTSGERIEVRNVTIRRLVAGDLIVDGAITAAKIASRTITADRIASGAITANEIKSRTITADRIVSGAITANEIAAGTITAAKIASRTITADRIVSGAITANEIAANAITAAKISAGAITADKLAANAITSKTITGSTITGGTISGATITSETLMKTYGGMYVGSEIWGGFKKDSNGNYSSAQTFTIRGSTALQIDGNPTRISSVTGEVKIGDASSYDNLRAREIYAQEIIYTNDLRTRDAAQLSLSNVSMRSANAFIDFSSGYGVIRVTNRNHLYLQTKGNTGGDTSAEIRCTRYADTSNYVNIRAYNVCAQNAVYANGVNVSSDINRKRDIELYSTDALQEVCSTPVYAYHLDTDKDEELKRIGIIMQEAPLDAIDLTGKGVDLYQMVTMLWRAVQQQQEIINELKGE